MLANIIGILIAAHIIMWVGWKLRRPLALALVTYPFYLLWQYSAVLCVVAAAAVIAAVVALCMKYAS